MFNMALILPIVRHLLQFAAGYLIASGHLDPQNAETLVGALVGLLTVAWWFFTRPSKPAADAAKAVDKGQKVTVESPQGGTRVINADRDHYSR